MSKFIPLESIPDFSPIAGFAGKLVHTQSQTLAVWKIEKGAVLPEHHHVHEQVTMVTKGQLEFTMNGQTMIMEPGSVIVIPSNVSHSGVALTDCEVTDIFCPAREDYEGLRV